MDCHDIALLVIGNGRLDYLHDVVDSALEHLPELGAYLMIDDSGDTTVRRELDRHYPDFDIWHHDQNLGMARAVQNGFTHALSSGAEYVFWLEEDMRIVRPVPVCAARDVLDHDDQIAQMLFARQPLTPEEHELGGVHGAFRGLASHYKEWSVWAEHDWIFSLNPCLIPRRVLEDGWDRDNEAGTTARLKAAGYLFGVWGHAGDEPYVEHIGVGRGKKWQL
jgi:glycosyltransferase involved in cell wall biosynthesis